VYRLTEETLSIIVERLPYAVSGERSGVIMEWLISWRSDLLAAYAASTTRITITVRYTDLFRLHLAGILYPGNPAPISLGLELIA
jgi:hypothetical protein